MSASRAKPGDSASDSADRGERTDARERLLLVGEIAAEIVHELRNALQIVTTSAYLAKQNPAASVAHLDKIERNAHLAQTIVDDLLNLARGTPREMNPVQVAEAAVAARVDLEADRIAWADVATPLRLEVRAHRGLLVRLLHVLYENATQVSAPGPVRIETLAWQEGESVIVEVADDGPGVPSDVAGTIFEPLVTMREGGTGLGLSLARRIAEAHGGALSLVPSEKGARFRLTLPSC